MPNLYLKITARGPFENKDIAAFLLIQAGSPGVVEDAPVALKGAVLGVSPDDALTEKPPKAATLIAYLKKSSSGVFAPLKKELKKIGWSAVLAPYKDIDWSQKWRKGLRTIRIPFKGKAIVIKPRWKKHKKRPGDVVIAIEPGMAFGTGSHETTRMCIKEIARVLTSDEARRGKSSILDVGCGSGILAIAAKKLGVKRAVAIDIDPVAVKVAKENAKLNRVNITASGRHVKKVKGAFSIVAANIISGALKALGPELVEKLKADGFLIVSGILRHETSDMCRVFTGQGLCFLGCSYMSDWASLVFRKEDGA
ncbi:MAG: 50S ribosomal protein L11 methyltransferase [Deltaproteobacteria bacterium]|nr:50S ribosomal protein L11 methyltransferase [Deltaproteobacteria bacterium]